VGFGDLMTHAYVINDLSSVWEGIKIVCGIKCDSLSIQKGSDASKGSYKGLFILYFEFES
jgi:hypothetical protein